MLRKREGTMCGGLVFPDPSDRHFSLSSTEKKNFSQLLIKELLFFAILTTNWQCAQVYYYKT